MVVLLVAVLAFVSGVVWINTLNDKRAGLRSSRLFIIRRAASISTRARVLIRYVVEIDHELRRLVLGHNVE